VLVFSVVCVYFTALMLLFVTLCNRKDIRRVRKIGATYPQWFRSGRGRKAIGDQLTNTPVHWKKTSVKMEFGRCVGRWFGSMDCGYRS